jgi:hypothetical protein
MGRATPESPILKHLHLNNDQDPRQRRRQYATIAAFELGESSPPRTIDLFFACDKHKKGGNTRRTRAFGATLPWRGLLYCTVPTVCSGWVVQHPPELESLFREQSVAISLSKLHVLCRFQSAGSLLL